MERLNLEQLARLVDERPTPREQAILDANPDLVHELEALKGQTDALQDLPSVLPPPGGWPELESALLSAGLMRRRFGGFRISRGWLQAAAGLVLFVGGAAVGALVAPTAQPDVAVDSPPESPASFTSLDEARMAVQAAEQRWVQTYGAYQRLAEAQSLRRVPQDPATRLAALEALLAASQAAVEESPADPFFNGFLVSTLAERQQALRQISQDNWH